MYRVGVTLSAFAFFLFSIHTTAQAQDDYLSSALATDLSFKSSTLWNNTLILERNSFSAQEHVPMFYGSKKGGNSHFGVSYRFGSFIMGVEAHYSGLSSELSSNGSKMNAVASLGNLRTQTANTQITGNSAAFNGKSLVKADASMRYRFGRFLLPNVLAYGTFGTAHMNIERSLAYNGTLSTETVFIQLCPYFPIRYSYDQTNFGGTLNSTAWNNGWIMGGGIEMLLGGNWHVQVEYNYIDFGVIEQSVNFSDAIRNAGLAVNGQGLANVKWNNAFHTAKFAVSYKF